MTERHTLLMSLTSPYSRSVRVMVREAGLGDLIDEEVVDPFSKPAKLVAANPLSQIPTLVRPDGSGVFDSAVIVDYLDSLAEGTSLIAREGEQGLAHARRRALVQGGLDAAVRTLLERRRPVEQQGAAALASWRQAMFGVCDVLEGEAETFARERSFPTLAVGVMLGYFDFRMTDLDWRAGRPRLAALAASLVGHPSLAETAPPAA